MNHSNNWDEAPTVMDLPRAQSVSAWRRMVRRVLRWMLARV